MSENRTFVFGDGANSSLNALLPFLQQRGIDPAYLTGLMGNNNGGFFGNNAWEGIIALIVVAAIFGNGNFGFGGFGGNGGNLVASTAEREMLMSAIQRNGVDLSQLAQSINCSNDRLRDAIGDVSTQICNFAGQNGLSFQQVINSIQSGNAALASQLCNCCCDIKQLISESNYLTERGFCNTNQILSRGFSDLGYASAQQTCELKGAIKDSTDRIIDGQRAAELRALTDKIDALREKNSTLTTQLNLEHQNQYTAGVVAQSIAPVNAALADLSKRLADIECNQPEVAKIPYIPAAGNYIPVNYSVPMHFGVSNYGGCGYNYGC
jgi:hypothetical protein